MYHWSWAVAGFLVVLITASEVFGTTTQSGLAPLTKWFARTLRGGLARLHRMSVPGIHNRLGLIVTMSMVLSWIGWMWIGWTMVFLGAEDAVVNGSTREPADFWARVYYAGFVFSTLGLGDYQPGTSFWQVTTAVASTLGFFVVTFSISFLVPLVQAAMFKWNLALNLHRSLPSPEAAVLEAWNGESLSALEGYFETVRDKVIQLEHSLRLYPILWDFRNQSHLSHIVLGLTSLYETLILAECGVASSVDSGKARQLRRALRAVQEQMLELSTADLHQSAVPDPPSLAALAHGGLPVADPTAFANHVARHAEARRRWHALMIAEGIEWHMLRQRDEQLAGAP
jgi:hypothetical protein